MVIEVPDADLRGVDVTPELAKLEMAVGLYRDRRVTLGQGARITGLSSPAFLKEVGSRGVTVNYDVEEFRKDLLTLDKFHQK